MFHLGFVPLVWALLMGHALADYPLQGDFLARGKNASAPIPGVPWQTILASHALIHAGFVWLFTGSLWLGLAEFVAHALIDHAKCTGRLGSNPERAFNIDQGLHVACKVLWAVIAVSLA
jgi:hypothetical protein